MRLVAERIEAYLNTRDSLDRPTRARLLEAVSRIERALHAEYQAR